MEREQSGLLHNLYYYVQQRVTTDWTTDAGMAVLLTFITCGIYGFYILYKLIERRDAHLARMANVVNLSIAMLRQKAESEGKTAALGDELAQLELIQREMYDQSRERGAPLWVALAIFTGVGLFIGYYFIMTDMVRHDRLESGYFTVMSRALAKLELSTRPSQAAPETPERNFVSYLLLSLVTCGFFSFYWMYVLIDDGNRHVERQVQWEDFVYSALAAA